MASYNELNALIDAYINRNGVQAITGQILNGVLKAMVEQLGRGYTIMGAAIPTTDPGTPDGPECYFASETGTYTDFDGLQVAPGELALLCYTPSDGWTKATIYEGLQEVGATIDGNVGTPSVGVSYANGVLSFDFRNMKGNPGEDGNDGAPAGFGTIAATVDENIGTPGVTVQSSGPDTAKNITFAFTNLKGETGVTSVVATVDNTTGNPACTVSLEGQQLTLAFSGLKGAQGDTGSSVDYPFTIVNNLTTDDATQALSAAQGVVLDGKVTQLEAKVDEIDEAIDAETTSEEVSEHIPYVQNIGGIGANGSVYPGLTGYRYTDPILLKAGESLKMKAITGTAFARLCSYDPDTQTRTVLLLGASTSTSSAADAYENTYTATEDIYLVACYMWNYYPLELTKTYTKVTTTSVLDGIGVMEDILEIKHDTETVTEDIPLTIVTGKYYSAPGGEVGTESVESSRANYNRSEAFEIKSGDTIYVNVTAPATSVAIFAVKDGSIYRSLQNGGTGERTITYIAPYDTLGIVSFQAGTTPTVQRTRTLDDYDSARIVALEESIGQVDVLAGQVTGLEGEVADVKGKVNPIVTDDMTTDIVTGKFIAHNGEIGSNESFAYKEFQVRARAKITVQCTEHRNIAVIAKKVSDTKYEELVAGTTQTAVTVNYVATQTMTIAVSFYATQDRSIVIDTDYVDSNNIEIVALQQRDADEEVRQIDLGFLFNKIAVIGDSMSVATMDGYTPPLGASWLSFLAKRWASVGKQWYAMGGTGAYNWLNDTTYGLGKLLADETIYNCYFIAYGHNDSATVGEATDEAAPVTITDGVPSCPDGYSFCAYYKAIINQIRAKAPHAMIFCLSQYDYAVAPGGWHYLYGEAVVDVAELIYNGGDKLVHHLDTGGVPVSGMDIGGHYSTIGYAYIAKRINDEANKVIYQYRADTEIKTFGVYNL